MSYNSSRRKLALRALVASLFFLSSALPGHTLERAATLYDQLKAFSLGYASTTAENLVLHKDRVTLTFARGTFYFPAPLEGKVRGAVFIGEGTFHADVPPNEFERDNVKRLLKADDVTSNFK